MAQLFSLGALDYDNIQHTDRLLRCHSRFTLLADLERANGIGSMSSAIAMLHELYRSYVQHLRVPIVEART